MYLLFASLIAAWSIPAMTQQPSQAKHGLPDISFSQSCITQVDRLAKQKDDLSLEFQLLVTMENIELEYAVLLDENEDADFKLAVTSLIENERQSLKYVLNEMAKQDSTVIKPLQSTCGWERFENPFQWPNTWLEELYLDADGEIPN